GGDRGAAAGAVRAVPQPVRRAAAGPAAGEVPDPAGTDRPASRQAARVADRGGAGRAGGEGHRGGEGDEDVDRGGRLRPDVQRAEVRVRAVGPRPVAGAGAAVPGPPGRSTGNVRTDRARGSVP